MSVILLLAAAAVFGQSSGFISSTAGRIRTVTSDPTGVACTAGEIRDFNGAHYTCQGGVFAPAAAPTSAGVASFKARTGAVVPASGDYDDTLVSNTSAIAGATVKAALDAISAALAGKQATLTTSTDLIGKSVTITAAGAGAPAVARTHASTVASDPFMGVQNSSNVWQGGLLGSGKYNDPAVSAIAPAIFSAAGTLGAGTRSGNTTEFASVTGAKTAGKQLIYDASGNIIVSAFDAGAAGGGGDFSSNTATSVDGEVLVFSGTGGKTGKRATGTGFAKLTSGVLSAGSISAGDIPDLSSTYQPANANLVTAAGTLTANAPMIGAGSKASAVGSRSGNTTEFGTITGTKTTGKQLAFDASGNIVASAIDVGGTGSASALPDLTDVTITSIADGQCLVYEAASSQWKNVTCPGGTTYTGGLGIDVVDGVINLQTAVAETRANNQSGADKRCTGAGTAGAQTCALAKTLTTYTDGMVLTYIPGNTNSTTQTVNIDTVGVRSILKHDGTALAAGDLTAGRPYQLTYVLADTTWRLPPVGVGGGLVDQDYGDITVGSGGTTMTINTDAVTEAKMILSDNTTRNVSATMHGFAPKADGDGSLPLCNDGTYNASCKGSGTVTIASQATAETGTNNTEVMSPLRVAQAIRARKLTFSSSGTSVFVATATPTLQSYVDGMIIPFQPNFNCGGTVTINIDGLGVKNIYTEAGTATAACLSGRMYQIAYDATLNASAGGFKLLGGAVPADSTLVLSDITSGNVNTSRHGLAPKAPNVATQFLNGVGAYSTPAPAGSDTQVQFNDGGAYGGDAGLTYNKTTDSLTVVGSITTGSGSGAAGVLELGQGTAPAAGTTSIKLTAPSSVQTSSIQVLPDAPNTGFYYGTNSSGTVTWSQVAGNGTGNVLRSAGTAAIASGKTLTVSNSMTQTATDGSTVAFGAGGTVAYTIASGTAALGTSAIASGACATVVTATATGAATTDVLAFTPNADITAVTGYAPVTTGGLAIYPYVTANTANFKICNPTASSITPGAVTLNWRITR